ncbi:MAG: hypothetical protein EA404_03040 [Spirochaetaceae bacterium]|nr:MAG: hypothetical protein EA404_03040 [Spirochaetaceae bacterium]
MQMIITLLRVLAATLFLGLLLLGPVAAVVGEQQTIAPAVDEPAAEGAGYLQLSERRGALTTALVGIQQRMHATLRELMVTVRAGGVEVWMVLSVLGLFYGVVHSLLPGHRKMLLFSYFLSKNAPLRHGVIAGVALGALHALTALAVVAVGYYVLQLSLAATVEQATALISRVTAVFIVGLGAVLLFTHLRELVAHDHGHAHDHDHAHNHDHAESNPAAGRGFLSALIVSGIVPCPGATMVLLLAVALAAIPAGIVVVASMSLGMAVTLSLLSVLTILFKSRMRELLDSERGHRLHMWFEIAASSVIVVFGLILLMTPPL